MGVKITDVAKMAGVSIATVSNVINETRPVRPETKQRVLDAIRELNYIPDSSAPSRWENNAPSVLLFRISAISFLPP